MHNNIYQEPKLAVEHLKPEIWEKANILLLKKALCEFSHELLILPKLLYEKNGWGNYILKADQQGIEYHFKAQKLSLDHWYIHEESIDKFENGKRAVPDMLKFILEFRESLHISSDVLPDYMEEITSTLYSSAYKLAKQQPHAAQLAKADHQQIEVAMTAGHPCFVASNGRIGFDGADYQAYAPEAGAPVRLIWLAGHKSKTSYAGIRELSYEMVLEQELDTITIAKFFEILHDKNLNPADYFLMPVHPWQWFNKLTTIFAPDIASGLLVCLGYASDEYLAQQSIRTFYNISNTHKFYTKTALSVLNMGFMRGLSPYYMSSAPAIMEWISERLEMDDYLQQKGFAMLREVASVGYRNLYYEPLGKNLPYNKMLSTLWRESPVKILKPRQKLMTMAALLHIDNQGTALLPELIKSSGLSITSWLQKYLDCYLSPLLHCFYEHDMVFMPHGENLILVTENNVPVRAIMKDITEEVVIFNPDVDLPEKVRRLYAPVPDELKILSIFTDIFDCFFRFVAHILVEHVGYCEQQWWELVALNIHAYQNQHLHLTEKFEHYDLFVPEFARSCLNRLQLHNNRQMIDLTNPAGNLQFAGTLKNPVAKFKEKRSIQGTMNNIHS